MKFKFFLLFLLLLLSSFSVSVSAEDPLDYDTFDTEWEIFLKEIPSDIAEFLPDVLSESLTDTPTDRVSASSLFRYVLDPLLAGIGTYGKFLLSLVSVLVLCALFEVLKSSLRSEAMHGVFNLAGNLCLCITVCTVQTRILDYAFSFFSRICTIGNAMIPVMTTVYTASGNITLGAVNSGGMALFIALIENVFSKILAPILKICFCFHYISAFTTDRYLNGVNKILKSVYTTVLTTTMTVFSLAMGAKQLLAASSDNFIIKSARLALGTFVPLVTSSVSGSLSTVATALSLIKNTCGIAGILIVVIMVLPILTSVILNRTVLNLASSVASLLGATKQERILSDTASLCGYLVALVACAALLFIYLLALFVKATLALG